MPIVPHVHWVERADTAAPSHNGSALTPEDLINQAERHFNTSLSSILIAWGLTLLGSLVVLALFSSLRDKYDVIYKPRIAACKDQAEEDKRQGIAGQEGIWRPGIPEEANGALAWLKPLWHDLRIEFGIRTGRRVRQRDFAALRLLGLDAVTFLQFLRLLRWLFLAITVLVAVPLIIINYFLSTHSEFGFTSTNPDDLTSTASLAIQNFNATAVVTDMQTITAAYIKGKAMYVHILFEWVITALVFLFVQKHCDQHEKLVEEWTELNYNEDCFRTVLLSHMDLTNKTRTGSKKLSYEIEDEVKSTINDAIVEADFDAKRSKRRKGLPAPPLNARIDDVRVMIIQREVGPLHVRMEKVRRDFWPLLDQAVGRVRRLEKEGKSIEPGWFVRLWHFLGLGRDKDIGHVVKDLQREIEEVHMAQETIASARNMTEVHHHITAAFITYETAGRAHQVMHHIKDTKELKKLGAKVQRAPRIKNLIFKNLAKDPAAWRSHNIMGFIALLVICAFNTVPLLGIQILANLQLLAETIPRLKQLQESSIILKGLIAIASGIVPPAIAAMFSYLLPFIIRFLSRWSGALTRSQLDKEVISRLFAFLLLWNFFFFSCIGVIYETGLTLYSSLSQDKSWADAFASLGDIPGKISKSYISQSSYWLSWFPIRSAVCCLQLLQLPRWFLKAYELLYAYRDGLTGNTEHAVSQPVNFEFAIEYSHVMFAMVVALVLTPLAPLVAIVGTIYFWTASVVFQNQLLYVENAKETDGAVWQTVIHRLLVATVIMQLLMCLTISLKAQDPVMSVLSFLPVGCVVYLKHFISSYRSFAYFFQHSEDAEAINKRRRKQRGHGHGIGRLDGYGKELFEAHSWLPRWKWTEDELKTLKELSGKHPGLKDIVPELREKEPEPEEKPKPKRRRRLWGRNKSKNHDRDKDKDRSRTRSKNEASSRRRDRDRDDEKRSRGRHRRHH